MSSYVNHRALTGLTLGKSIDYRGTYDASLLQGVSHSPSHNPPGLKADNLLFRGTDIWTLHELSRLNAKGLPQVAVGYAEPDHTSTNLIKPKNFRLHLNSLNQTRFNNQDEVRWTLEHDLSTCTQGKVSVALYRLDELEDQPIDYFNDTCIDDQDITIDNYEFTTDHLESATCGEKVVEETFVGHLLKSNCLIAHQPGWDSARIQYRGRQIDREKLLCYLVSSRHHNEFHGQCVERIFSDLLRFYQPERLSVYACYTRRGGPDINLWCSNDDFVPSTTRLARQ